MSYIYFDNAGTTKVRPEVRDEILPYLDGDFGNPSAVYNIARKSKKAVELAREQVAKAIGASPDEIFFTGSGTESDNWAIKGVAEANKQKGRHIITSAIEHHAVLHTCEYLSQNGYELTVLPVDEHGLINLQELEKAIRPDTILISVMFANNEIGTIQPVKEIGKIARDHGIYFHTDAVQAVGHVMVDVVDMNIDLLSLSAHKMYAPKGTGALYIRKGTKIKPILHGGGQERNRRAGTENLLGIAALGKAIELLTDELEEESRRLIYLRQKLIDGIFNEIPYVRLNGHPEKRLPGNINFSFEYIEGESILLMLDMKGIYASSGSACTSGSLDPSHVLLALGLSHATAHGSLRITLGKFNSEEDIDVLLKELPPIIKKLRDMSPLYDKK